MCVFLVSRGKAISDICLLRFFSKDFSRVFLRVLFEGLCDVNSVRI